MHGWSKSDRAQSPAARQASLHSVAKPNERSRKQAVRNAVTGVAFDRSPRRVARLLVTAGMALVGSATDFARLIAEETEKWAKVIKFAGIKAE